METVGMRGTRQSLVRQFAAQLFETDEYLIDRVVSDNDKYAAETLLERYYKAVYKVIYIKVHDVELAKDLTQETFISVLRALPQYDESKGGFKTWACKIAQNKVIDYTRSRQYKESLITEFIGEDEGVTESVDDLVMKSVTKDKIRELISQADEQSRKIFIMKAREGYTFGEISERTGMPASTIKTKYYALIKNLRKEMREYE